MLAICIPIFNVDVRPLVEELHQQASSCGDWVRILLIDDGSTKFRDENRSLGNMAKLIELPENIGRSKIRNLFLQYTEEDYLLFLDCDVVINDSNFIGHYLQFLKNHPSLVCGGHLYRSEKPERSERLRWKYGFYKESKSVEERKVAPNKSFMTNNFVIKRTILEEIRFDERLRNYGHEDTLFGIQLKRKAIKISHINNPVLIGDQEKNDVFLKKTELGVQNLKYILQFPEFENDLWNEVALLRFYKKSKKLHFLLYPLFKLIKTPQRVLFTKGYVNLLSFDFYKLGIFMEQMRLRN